MLTYTFQKNVHTFRTFFIALQYNIAKQSGATKGVLASAKGRKQVKSVTTNT